MKKHLNRLLGLALAGLILGACSQTATFEDGDLMNEQASAERAGFKLNPFNVGGNENAAILAGGGDCENDCIDENSGELFAATASSPLVFWGGPNQNNNSKTLSVKVWNTLTTIEYRFTLTTDANSAGNLQYFDETAQDWLNTGALTTGQAFTVSRPLPIGWKACDVVTEQWRQTGGGAPAILGDVSYSLIGICNDCDEESFSYETSNENLDVVFSYNYSEEAEMTLTFTLPQAKIVLPTGATYIGADSKSYLVGGNGTNLTWTGMVSCSNEEPTTFEFEFAADCGPSKANDGKANIWTNTEVKAINGVVLVDDPNTPENEGPYSLKGALPNIVYSGCPISTTTSKPKGK